MALGNFQTIILYDFPSTYKLTIYYSLLVYKYKKIIRKKTGGFKMNYPLTVRTLHDKLNCKFGAL